MRMYFLTATALSGINLQHLVTTEAEHCLCVATMQLSWGVVIDIEVVCLPYAFGFPFAAIDMRCGLHNAELPRHSSYILFSCNDGLTTITQLT